MMSTKGKHWVRFDMQGAGNIAKRAGVRKKLSLAARRRWANPQKRSVLIQSLRNADKRRSKTAKEQWRDPIIRARRIAGLAASKCKPGYRARQSKVRVAYIAAHSDAVANWLRTQRGRFYSRKNRTTFWFDSSWERERMRSLEKCENVVSYRREPVQIPYSLNGLARYYRPDLLVTYASGRKVLEEIKPKNLCDLPVTKAKFQAARAFCRTAGLEFRVLKTLDACREVKTNTKEN